MYTVLKFKDIKKSSFTWLIQSKSITQWNHPVLYYFNLARVVCFLFLFLFLPRRVVAFVSLSVWRATGWDIEHGFINAFCFTVITNVVFMKCWSRSVCRLEVVHAVMLMHFQSYVNDNNIDNNHIFKTMLPEVVLWNILNVHVTL